MDAIGGYRVIRKLGSGGRSEVFLGRAESAPGSAPQLAAVKVFRPGASLASIDAEIHALSSLDSPHIVSLLDLASGPGNLPALILQRLAPGGLVGLLAGRSTLLAGEAVTILAPIALAVDHLHGRGFAHGHLSSSAVHFDASGAPVLIGFGSASRVAAFGDELSQQPSPAEREADDGVRRDLASLTALIRTVLSRVDGGAVGLEFLGAGAAGAPVPRSPMELAELLFALAPALPVSFEQPADEAASGAIQPLAIRPEQAEAGTALAGSTPSRELGAITAPVQRWALDRVRPLRAMLGAVRKRIWVVAGVGVAALIASVLLASAPTSAGLSSAPPSPSAVAPEPAVADSAIAGDDPVAAASALIQSRQACFRDRSIVCLDGVDQPDSAAWQSDVDAIRDLQDGGELQNLVTGPAGELIERLGGSALVSLGPPQGGTNATASVLIVKTEAGWRIRSLLPAR